MRFFFSLFFLVPLWVWALPGCNPSSPLIPEEGFIMSKEAFLTLEAGYLGDWVFERELELRENEQGIRDQFDNFKRQTQSGFIGLNFADRVEFFSLLGVSNLKFSQLPSKTTKIDYNSDFQFYYGFFAEALLAYWGKVDMSLASSYGYYKGSFDHVEVNGASIHPNASHYKYQEWNVSLAFSYKMDIFTPYLGFSYAHLQLKLKGLNTLPLSELNALTINNKRPVGLFGGFSIEPFKAVSLNLEARVIDEIALTLSLKVRF